MALDTTVKGTSSDSYVTVAEADSYFSEKSHFSATWSGYDTTTKENWLKEGTRALDRLSVWRGYPTSTTQRLAFPREIGSDVYYPASSIHRYVKEAQMELTMLLALESDSTSGQMEYRQEKSISVGQGKISITYESKSFAGKVKIASGGNINTVTALMRPWHDGSELERR